MSAAARLVATRVTRMFAYGGVSVVLALYLSALGFSDAAIGLLLSLTLFGDAVVSLILTTSADGVGRRRTLVAGAGLMCLAGVTFAATHQWWLLLAAAIVGVISPTGNETGPFLSIEQAALAEVVAPSRRTHVFAWYQVAASLSTAAGALVSGIVIHALEARGTPALRAYQLIFVGYAVAGVLLALVFWGLPPGIEVPAGTAVTSVRRRFGLHQSQGIVARLSALFALDSFAGGFIVQTLVAYWFHVRFGIDERSIGAVLFGANLVAGLTSLGAAALASRIGLVRTMFVTHLPSNVLLCLVPFMPTLPLAVTVLWLRFSISQMDVPTRQSYVVAVVAPDERSAAAGITTIARSLGASLAPVLSGIVMGSSLAAPFVISGGLKIVYDVLLYRGFKSLKTPEESHVKVPRVDGPGVRG